MNIAEILYERGNLDEAESRLRNSLHVYRASGYRYFLAQCLTHLGRLAYRAHRVEEAVTMLDEALTIFTDVGAEEDVVDVLARRAECDLLIGDSDGALALVDEAWARTLASDAGRSSVPLLLRSRGYALAQMGRLDEARAAIDQSLEAARSRRQDLDVALTLHPACRRPGGRGQLLPARRRRRQSHICRRGDTRSAAPRGRRRSCRPTKGTGRRRGRRP